MVNIDPLRDEANRIVGVINCFQDITDRKLADERQAVLINELNHRVKNTLATVQAIAAHTFGPGAADDAPRRFEGRLLTLARTHDVLTDERWEGVDLGELVGAVAAPLRDTFPDRIALQGPQFLLPPKLASSLALALHELSTNAVTHGSLSDASGAVELRWTVGAGGAQRWLHLDWRGFGGPPVTSPARRGAALAAESSNAPWRASTMHGCCSNSLQRACTAASTFRCHERPYAHPPGRG